ncbi:MAG: YaaA family protein [Flavobacteriales bacterium]|nr:YaaA family protein [Flavobacteriales bacterium]
MPYNLKILLSPTKTMNRIDLLQNENNTNTYPDFLERSELLIKELRKLSIHEISSEMNVSTKIAEQNHSRFKNWLLPDKSKKSWSIASCLYSGEVYKALDFNSLNKKERLHAQNCLFILSGLYGIIRAEDCIYPYRLEMGHSLKTSQNKISLYKFWGNEIYHYLIKHLNQEDIIINLASNEYFKVIKKKELKNQIITPIFKTLKNGSLKTIAIHSKLARGLMARFIITNNISSIEELKKFNGASYLFDEKLSVNNELFFIKNNETNETS